jgi:hypothetical protein
MLRSIEVFTLNNPLPPAFQLLQSIQKLINILYLTKLDADDKVKVRNYMTEAETELERVRSDVMMLTQRNTSPLN